MSETLPSDPPDTDAPVQVHASCVAVSGKALLIIGPSGTGKSSLALELMALGAQLVADDQTALRLDGNRVIAQCPPSIEGRIEARGIGLLNAPPSGPTPVVAILDLATSERDRLPPFREAVLLGQVLPLLHKAGNTAFPAALMQYLKEGRRD
ncbi:HPr kinase/phosphorylase [Cognatishimia sp. MH4019]|uniref:HPr kinase/phosphorylase n=1 Tax=Cognatishimia sp. MH4019 TaxID=2854030 RepID=UPI001CD2B0C1|nr:HPr kinase/phosphatase C-terminal domain-containing protein [Cognatishimia sp. MH4019]